MSSEFNVVWVERMSVNVNAKDEEEAINKVIDLDYDQSQVVASLDSRPTAHKIATPNKNISP